jgi:hypothetical protein
MGYAVMARSRDPGDTHGEDGYPPQTALSVRLISLKVVEDHSAWGTDSRANCSVNGMTGIRARMISPRMMPTARQGGLWRWDQGDHWAASPAIPM